MFGGALLGLLLHCLLPEYHLRDNSKDTVKVVTGMIATLAALVLGLLVGSAKSSFDATSTAITQSGAKIILLDRVLAAYGPETKDVREQLRGANNPKLRNSMVSQKSSTTRKGTGSALCACSINSQRACSISLLICSACESN